MSGNIKLRRRVLTLVAASKSETCPRLSLDEFAWRKSFRNGEQGRPLRNCPYSVGSIEHWSWSSGYVEGKAAHLKGAGT